MTLRLSILGTGYVGLVSGAGFAKLGHDVTCVDTDPAKVAAVNAGRSFLHEPGLAQLLGELVPSRLRATADVASAVRDSDVTMIAVPTPFDADSGEIDLSFVEKAVTQIGHTLRDKTAYHVVAVKSTCVPGTADGLVCDALERASGKRAGVDFGVASNPEFLSEGTAVADFLRPDRVVYGGDCDRTRQVMADLHAPFGDVPTLATNNATAELVKYASNALLATCVSFANEIADVAEEVGGVDAEDVSRGLTMSRYLKVGGRPAPLASFLRAGCGYGGSCLPKDVAALAAHGRRAGLAMPMLSAVARTNDERASRLVRRIARQSTLDGCRVAVLGTAFKPGTADLRTSPAVPIIDELLARSAVVTTFDPAANDATRRAVGDRATVVESLKRAVDDADVIVIATAWPDFAAVPELIDGRDPQPLVVDGRRMLRPDSVERYLGVGLSNDRHDAAEPVGDSVDVPAFV